MISFDCEVLVSLEYGEGQATCTVVPLGMFSEDGDDLCQSRELKSLNVCVRTDSSADKPKECSRQSHVERIVNFCFGNT